MPYRQLNVSFKDLWNANTVKCDGSEGKSILFCDVNMGRHNCEISTGLEMEGAPCFCDYLAINGPNGFFPGGRRFGRQKTANEF